MNTQHEKERVLKTTWVSLAVMAVVVILILAAVSNPRIRAITAVLVILVGGIALIVQWMLVGKRPQVEQEGKPVAAEVTRPKRSPTQTGASCQKEGEYHCNDHPEMKINMDFGKRFPPCRAGKGHSASWVLEE